VGSTLSIPGGPIERGGRGSGRQYDSKRGACARGALDLEAAAVGCHDAVGDGEPEPSPSTDIFGGEEWLEDPAEALWWDASTVVANGHARIVAAEVRAHPDVSAGRCCVARIGEQVHEHLVHLPRIALDRWHRGVVPMDREAVAPARLEQP